MRHVIYIDVFWAINFLMDYLILIIVKQILKISGGLGRPETDNRLKLTLNTRCVIAAVIGAVYAVVILIVQIKSDIL